MRLARSSDILGQRLPASTFLPIENTVVMPGGDQLRAAIDSGATLLIPVQLNSQDTMFALRVDTMEGAG